MKFTEATLEQAVIEIFNDAEVGIPHHPGGSLDRAPGEVLLKDDLRAFLSRRYRAEGITEGEVNGIIRRLEQLPHSDLYGSNKQIMKWVSDGFLLKREDRSQKDLYIQLIDYTGLEQQYQPEPELLDSIAAEPEEGAAYGDGNIYRIVNQLEIQGYEKRIPDAIVFVNGLPLVVWEFKTAVRENATIHDAFTQLTVRYRRDIPELFKYNAFCVVSDGANSKAGSFFADYDYFYGWRKITGDEHKSVAGGIASLKTLVKGMFQKDRFRDILRNFIYFPDSSAKDEKIVCRYPQYYGARKLFANVLEHCKPEGDGKGGTYFGATGCGKSYTMLYLSRLMMKSVALSSPTILLITDRTDLDDQLSATFTNAKKFIGDEIVISVNSRAELRELLRDRQSGGVFLTTIQKFSEDSKLLSKRNNIICISDEAHRSQVNREQKVRVTKDGVKKTFGFAKHLHRSLPNATYVGFTGTPIDKTLEVFGPVVDAYTMSDSVRDEITERIVYEGRAAKVLLDNKKLREIEKYYDAAAEAGANEYQIEESKKAVARMDTILGDPGRLKAVARDFVEHYEKRVEEGATVKGKAMFVCASRQIAFDLYQEIIALRPQWAEVRLADEGVELSEKEQQEIKPGKKIQLVMTRGKDDPEAMYKILGTKEDRKEQDRQFKKEKSNFKIAIVVDMWLTGFDVPFLDTIYIDKPVQTHNLIQTISRVNRKYPGKDKGLVVDYIGIKKKMDLALKMYSDVAEDDFEEIGKAIALVKDQLDLLHKIFYRFDSKDYFQGTALEQLECLNRAVEYVQLSESIEKRFMSIVRKLRGAYNLSCSSEEISQQEKDLVHFYFAIAAIVHKLTRGDAPDTAQMNAKVRQMIQDAIISEGVEEIFKIGADRGRDIDIFSESYLDKINALDLPNTRIKLLQRLLKMAIDEFKKTNKIQGVDFSRRLQAIVERYNDRSEVAFAKNVLNDLAAELTQLFRDLKVEQHSFIEMGIGFEEKAFYDILVAVARKYGFEKKYTEQQFIEFAKDIKTIVDDKAKYTDWSKRDDIKAELQVDLILALEKHGYPPVSHDDVYKEILEQAENFKKYQKQERKQRKRSILEINIDTDFDKISNDDILDLIEILEQDLQLPSKIRVLCKERGSVRLTLELGSSAEANLFMQAALNGQFDQYGITDPKIVELRPTVESLRKGEAKEPGDYFAILKEGDAMEMLEALASSTPEGSRIYKEAILLIGQWKRLQRDFSTGIVDYDTKSRTESRISCAASDLVDEIKKNKN